MFSGYSFPEALAKLGDNVGGELSKQFVEKVRDMTNGVVSVDSICKGQVTVDANSYIDRMLNKVSYKLQETGITELELPGHVMEFEKDLMCGLILPGEVNFQKGFIKGITTLTRMEEAILKINVFENPIINVRAVVGIKEALVNYLTNVKFLCLKQDDSEVIGGLKNVHLILSLTVGKNFQVNLEEFDVKSTGCLSLNGLETVGLFDFIREKISADMEKNIKQKMMNHLEGTIKDFTKEAISEIPLTF